MTEKELKDGLVAMGFTDTILFANPGYEDAFIGVTPEGVALYDYNLMVQFLIEKEGWDEMEAVEWIDYNCSYGGGGYPIVVYRDDEEDELSEYEYLQVTPAAEPKIA